ncbi:hypothetical protein JZ751_027986 [Albula glossodonta]|uniref:Prokaryotic-type class I peptide chain release factors domain-containing protein n=1 Tax=Albula glossodonta TaxID=121402 RepID=A0A8T2PEC6_9TELE|nr:hypothetical protein JZ751_027986 [Albula glossodonta]
MHKLVRLSYGLCPCYNFLQTVQNGARSTLLSTTPKPHPVTCLPWKYGFTLLRRYCDNNTASDLLRLDAVQRHIQGLVSEYNHITRRLENGLLNDSDRKVLNRRQVELLPLATAYQNTENAMADFTEVECLLQSGSGEDQQMFDLLKEEQTQIAKRIDALNKEVISVNNSQIDVNIDPKDLRIDTFRSKGAGGTTAECQQSRSQLQNRDTAMRVLRARIYQQMFHRESEKRKTARRHQVGTRSQSDRIRTYNFTQNRVTDHRIGYVTRDIKEFLRGGEALDELIAELMAQADREALLELLEQNTPGQTIEGKASGVQTLDL